MSNLVLRFYAKGAIHRVVVDQRDNNGVVLELDGGSAAALFSAMWDAGMRPPNYVEPATLAGSVVTINGRPAADYMSPSLIPDGWYTVISYLARHNPEMLALLDHPAEDTQRDGFWLNHQCKQRGIRPTKVVAPKVLQELGVHHVNIYPVDLLRQRFD